MTENADDPIACDGSEISSFEGLAESCAPEDFTPEEKTQGGRLLAKEKEVRKEGG